MLLYRAEDHVSSAVPCSITTVTGAWHDWTRVLPRLALHPAAPRKAPSIAALAPSQRPHPMADSGHHDLEAPGALLAAAQLLANEHNELVFMVTGPDTNSVRVTNSSLVSLEGIGLRKHTLVIADSWETCGTLLAQPCFWTSRTLRTKPSSSLTNDQFWDWRFKFYYIKKRYMAQLVTAGYSVLQTDTDTVWVHDPFPVLRSMHGASIVCMGDGPIANAGVLYARPGSTAAIALLEDVAWRVQLFQFWPEYVHKLVPFAQPPYYANSDDQTILNDAIVSAVLGQRTFLGSTGELHGGARCSLSIRPPPTHCRPPPKRARRPAALRPACSAFRGEEPLQLSLAHHVGGLQLHERMATAHSTDAAASVVEAADGAVADDASSAGWAAGPPISDVSVPRHLERQHRRGATGCVRALAVRPGQRDDAPDRRAWVPLQGVDAAEPGHVEPHRGQGGRCGTASGRARRCRTRCAPTFYRR